MHIAKKLALLLKETKTSFTFKSRVITPDEIVAEEGLLPGIAKRADGLSSLCFGYTLGATYDDTEGALLGCKVTFDEFTPDALRLFCMADVIMELIKLSPSSGAASLDELMYD